MSKLGKVPSKEWFDNKYKNSTHRNLKLMVIKYLINDYYRDDKKLNKLDKAEFKGLIFNLDTGHFDVNGYSIKPFITYLAVEDSEGKEVDIANNLPYTLKDFKDELSKSELKTEHFLLQLIHEAKEFNFKPEESNIFCNKKHEEILNKSGFVITPIIRNPKTGIHEYKLSKKGIDKIKELKENYGC